jgi:hypothetical protein
MRIKGSCILMSFLFGLNFEVLRGEYWGFMVGI